MALLAGVVIQAALALPLGFRMAAANDAPICHGPVGSGDAPAHPAHDHAHCLLCQAGGPLLLPPVVARPAAPSAWLFVAVAPAVPVQAVRPASVGFSPRAPPSRA